MIIQFPSPHGLGLLVLLTSFGKDWDLASEGLTTSLSLGCVTVDKPFTFLSLSILKCKVDVTVMQSTRWPGRLNEGPRMQLPCKVQGGDKQIL